MAPKTTNLSTVEEGDLLFSNYYYNGDNGNGQEQQQRQQQPTSSSSWVTTSSSTQSNNNNNKKGHEVVVANNQNDPYELQQCFSSPDFLDYEVAAPWDQGIQQSHTLPNFDNDDDDDDDEGEEAPTPASTAPSSITNRVSTKNPFDDNYYHEEEENTFSYQAAVAKKTQSTKERSESTATATGRNVEQWNDDIAYQNYRPREHEQVFLQQQQHQQQPNNNGLPIKKQTVEEEEKVMEDMKPKPSRGMRAVFGNPKPKQKKKSSATTTTIAAPVASVSISTSTTNDTINTTEENITPVVTTGPVVINPNGVSKSSAKDPIKMLFSNPKPVQKRPTIASNQLFV